MAIPKKAVILDLIEPHECGPKVDLFKKFSNTEELIYVPVIGKKTVQISNELDKMLADRRPKEHIKDVQSTAPVNILDTISSRLKGE
jgi:hypothetical protein